MRLEQYLCEREALISGAVPGIAPARRLARLTDVALESLAAGEAHVLAPRARWALIALGGYGSGALLPHSDLDLLIVSDVGGEPLRQFVERLLYPIWDAGLEVGHQVRTPREQLTATRTDLVTLTATLTGRVIAGDRAFGGDVLASCAKDAAKRRPDLLRALWSRQRPGSPYLLEPDLKDGAGGRRDFDELTWCAALLAARPVHDPGALVAAGFLSEEEMIRLGDAADSIAGARWELQRTGAGQLMSLEAADDLGSDAEGIQRALVDTHHILRAVRNRIAGHERPPGGPVTAEHVLDELARGDEHVDDLATAIWEGRLEHLLPGFAGLMTLRRPGLAHTLTVGAHCLRSAGLVGRLVAGNTGDHAAARSARAIADWRPVAIAALVHDAGKATPGPGHAGRGAAAARTAAKRFGLSQRADDVAELVALHLVLAETAARSDLDDEDAILRCARMIGRRELVAPLHLLTIADSLATGPGAWSDWHASLVGKLVTRVDAALSPDVDGAGIASSAELNRDLAMALLAEDSPEAGFVREAPMRYLADRTPESIGRHARIVAALALDRAPGAYELDITTGPLGGTFRATVVTWDKPGLFGTTAGVFALTGFDILGVEAITTSGGIALDTFTVRSATLAEISDDAWSRLERALTAVMRDRLAVGVRLAERRKHYRHTKRSRIRATISTDDPFAAILQIRTPDRVGLLYDIGRAIADSGMSIRSVTATTRSGIAEDTFRLTDMAGEVPRTAGVLGQLKMRLRELE